jgi:hypothetical protein
MSALLPRVLVMGDNVALPEVMNKLRLLAKVYTIPALDDSASVKAIAQCVKDNGPFVAFAVSGLRSVDTMSFNSST